MKIDEDLGGASEVRRLRACARPLLLESGIAQTPVGIWGTCFLAGYRRQLFLVTAAHLVRANHSGHVVFFPTDKSARRLRLHGGITVSMDATHSLDVIVYPATMEGLDMADSGSARLLTLDNPLLVQWHASAFVSTFFLVGYPTEINEVDYESGVVKGRQALLAGRYLGPNSADGTVHQLSVDNPNQLNSFGGFSGSPVFSAQWQIAAPATVHFCGIVVMGTVSSRLMHFIEAAAVIRLLDTAIEHISRFSFTELHLQASQNS